MSFYNFLFGDPETTQQLSTLTPQQQQMYKQYAMALQGSGAGGAFGDTADYYRDLLSDNGKNFQAFAAPEQRRFNEQIIPDLAEQFAGMGSGGMSGSGFRNAAVSAGTDLSERLGAIRAQLRQQGAQGLQSFAQGAFAPQAENIIRPATQGVLAPLLGTAAQAGAAYFGGPAATAAVGASGMKNSSPYGSLSNYKTPQTSQFNF